MDDKKIEKVVLAITRKLKGLSYDDAETVLIRLATMLKKRSVVG